MTAQQGSSIRFECPSCGGRVKVPLGQAGQKCQCPKCNAEISAPGGADQQPEKSPQAIEDDFFAEDPVTQPALPLDRSPAKPEPRQKPVSPPLQDTPRSAHAGAEQSAESKAKPVEPARQRPERSEFGIECGLCASRLYATLDQVGQTLRCPDCHSKVLVRAPRKRPEPAHHRERDEGDDFKLSEPVERPQIDYSPPEKEALPDSVDSAASSVPARKETPRTRAPENIVADAARQTMAKAQAEMEATNRAKPVLPDQPFKTGVLAFFFDAAAGFRWLLLTLMGHGFVASLCWALTMAQGGGAQQFIAVFLSVVVVGLGLAFVLLGSACSVAIIQDTTNGYDKIEQWPGVNIGEWMFDGFFVINSLLASAAPGILVTCAGFSGWPAVFVATTTAVAFFPILLLSALEQASPLGFASPAVWKSLRVDRPRWLRFYVLSAGLAVGGLLAASLLVVDHFFLWGLSCVALTAIAMIYFRLLGRLAWCISEPDTLRTHASAKKSDTSATKSDAERGGDEDSTSAE